MYIYTIRGRQLSQSLEIKDVFDLCNAYAYLFRCLHTFENGLKHLNLIEVC